MRMPSCIRCCTTLKGEVYGPMFNLVVVDAPNQPSSPSPSTEPATLDIVRTFSPRPRLLYITLKVFLAAWILAVLTMSIDRVKFPSFWLAYLTHWGLTLTALYFVMSSICALYLALRPPPTPATNENRVDTFLSCCGGSGGGGGGVAGCLVKTTWALLAIVIPGEVVITILFWALVYDGKPVTYVTAMVHGGTMILLLIDGFVLSRIPLRLKQFVFFESFSLLYFLWNIVHAYSGIGNPYNGVSQDDDAIYESLDWNTDPTMAIAVSVMALFVANPIIFGICWWLSRLLPMRLREDNINNYYGHNNDGGQLKQEEGEQNNVTTSDEHHEQISVVIH